MLEFSDSDAGYRSTGQGWLAELRILWMAHESLEGSMPLGGSTAFDFRLRSRRIVLPPPRGWREGWDRLVGWYSINR